MHIHEYNNKLDTRWFPPGMPAEDISISNNAKGGPLGSPAWEEAKFELKQSQIILTTQSMNYFTRNNSIFNKITMQKNSLNTYYCNNK